MDVREGEEAFDPISLNSEFVSNEINQNKSHFKKHSEDRI
jgi:hypothetical protein